MLIHLEKLGKSFGEKVVLHDVSASVEKEDRIGIVGQNGAGKTTLLKILTGVYTDYDGEFSVTHGVTLGYLEQNAKLDVTLDIYGEMRSSFAPVLDAMAQMQILEKKMAASPDDAALLEKHDELQNIIDAADGYNMDVNIKKVLSGMGFAQDTWQKNIAVFRFIPETFRERCISVVPEIYRFLSGGTDDRCDDFFACGDDFVWNRTFSGTELCPVIL